MGKHDNGGVPGMPQVTPIIGQRFYEVDFPASIRKIPLGAPLPLAGLFHGDKQQLDRIEEKLDKIEVQLAALLNPEDPVDRYYRERQEQSDRLRAADKEPICKDLGSEAGSET